MPRIKVIMAHLPGGMSCRDVEDFIIRYLDNELTMMQKLAFRLHITACVECKEYLKAYQMTRKLSKASLKADAHQLGEVPEDLVNAILATLGKKKKNPRD